MKLLTKTILVILGVVLAISLSNAQDYKHPYGMINEDGKVISPEGSLLGYVTKDGIIKDSAGTKIAHINGEGTLIDTKSGKKIGKTQKNGNYVAQSEKTPDENWTVSPPLKGTCEVKNDKGETVVIIHENYKQYGACAYHCLSMKKKGKAMEMK